MFGPLPSLRAWCSSGPWRAPLLTRRITGDGGGRPAAGSTSLKGDVEPREGTLRRFTAAPAGPAPPGGAARPVGDNGGLDGKPPAGAEGRCGERSDEAGGCCCHVDGRAGEASRLLLLFVRSSAAGDAAVAAAGGGQNVSLPLLLRASRRCCDCDTRDTLLELDEEDR